MAFVLGVYAGGLQAQSLPAVIAGVIMDAQSGEPVPYAHVGIAERGIGTTSGYDGRFRLKLPVGLRRDAALTISSIGYETFRESVSALPATGQLSLKPSQTSLTEVVVLGGDAALDIVRRAVAAIPDNYPAQPSNSLVFYRESLTDDSLRYRYLAEGVLDVHKTSYKNSREGQVGLVQARKINLRDPLDTTVNSGFTSGHMAAHRFDVVKNREDFLDETHFPVYDYRLEGMTTYNGSPVYIIGFEPDPEAKAPKPSVARRIGSIIGLITGGEGEKRAKIEARLKGRIFIVKDSHAFLRAEFYVTPGGQNRYVDYPLYSGTWRKNTYTVNYRESGGQWRFSDALREGERRNGAMYVNEVKATEIRSGRGEEVPYLERLTRNDAFTRVTGRYAPDFWRDYNVVPMREGLASGMRQFELMATANKVFGVAYQDSLQRVRAAIAKTRDSLAMIAAREIAAVQSDSAGVGGRSGEEQGFTIQSDDAVDGFEVDKRWGGNRFRNYLGFGVHALPSGPVPLSIAYRNPAEDRALALDGALGEQSLEALFRWNLDYRFNRHLFARYSSGFDFSSNVYKNQAIGLGAEANLRPRSRPINVRAVAQYSFLRYYRTVGKADVADSPIRIDDEKFKGDAVRLGYGDNRHDVVLTAEVSVETRRGREVYLRGSYHYNLQTRPGVWFKETGQVFRKDHRLALRDERVSVRSADMDYSAAISPETSWMVTAGWVFK